MDVLDRIPTIRLAPRLAVRLPLPSPDRQRFFAQLFRLKLGMAVVRGRYGFSAVAVLASCPTSTTSPSGQVCGPWWLKVQSSRLPGRRATIVAGMVAAPAWDSTGKVAGRKWAA